MRARVWLIVLVLFISFGLSAQDDDLSIAIGYAWAESGDEERLDAIIVTLQDGITAALEAHEVTPVYVDEDADLSINLDLVNDQATLYVDLVAVEPESGLFPSPLIVPHLLTEMPLVGSPDNPDLEAAIVAITTAVGLYILNDCEAAIPYFDSAEALNESLDGFTNQMYTYINFYRANCALAAEDYEVAAAAYEENLRIYVENDFADRYRIEATVNLAWALFQQDETALPLDLLDGVLTSKPEWIEVYPLMMHAYLSASNGDYDMAVGDMNAAIKVVPDDPLLYVVSAQVFILAEDYDSAAADLRQAQKINPDYADIYFYQGVVDYELGEEADALVNFDEYLALEPEGRLAEQAAEYITLIEG
jgi:tetratricopeptide (TPR) repeat protein